jgi:hypothetical protein
MVEVLALSDIKTGNTGCGLRDVHSSVILWANLVGGNSWSSWVTDLLSLWTSMLVLFLGYRWGVA